VTGGFELGRGLTVPRQPPVSAAQIEGARGTLRAYRFLAFLTGVVLICSCIAWAIWTHAAGTGYLWMAHGWFYLIYVVVTAILGFKLRWPLPRYVLVMLAGTVPTMSFVAEHFVTRAIREAAQPVPAAD
jgi:integral membrane protein